MHPDIQAATVEIVQELIGAEHTYQRLEQGFEDNLPAVLIVASQDDSGVFAEHTIPFEVYHDDIPKSRTLARTIAGHLENGPHSTSAGLIDEYETDVKLREVPYSNPNVIEFTFTMKARTRPA